MKTDLNIENKAKFFAQYWGQNIQTYKLSYSWRRGVEVSGSANGHLTLTPLSQITDEDAIEVAIIYGIKPEDILKTDQSEGEPIVDRYDEFGLSVSVKYWYESVGETTEWELRDFCINLSNGDVYDTYGCANNISYVVDYLRSKGYALPWMGLSVNEMVQSGWIKLNN